MRKGILKKLGISVLAFTLVCGSINIPILKGNTGLSYAATTETVLQSWDFKDGIQGWYYGGEGWESGYSGGASTSVESAEERLKVNVDYSADAHVSWSQMAVGVYNDEGWNLQGANNVTFDLYYDTNHMSQGSFQVKIYSNAGVDTYANVDFEDSEAISGTLRKVMFTIDFDEITSTEVKDLNICIIGNETNYKGSIGIDDIKIINVTDEEATDIYVNSTVVPVTGSAIQTKLEVDNGKLVLPMNSDSEEIELVTDIKLVDKNANDKTKQLYSYLEGVGRSSSAIFGQENNTHHKAGSKDLSSSDTYDIVNTYAGVIGIDTLSLTGNEYSASRYNAELGALLGATPIEETSAGNVAAAAALTNYNIREGGIITLSAHMPNFSIVEETGSYDGSNSYSRYNFTGYSPNTLTGDVMNQILPGGKYNQVYNAYLDMIADYAKQVDGGILFRPFHENTGSWFWWGAAFCDSETYKNVYRYTVEYMRDMKDVHNLIYVYGPSSEAANVEEYGLRYPGDDYVDMVGFDMYHIDPTPNDSWFNSFLNELNIVEQFAKEHDKLFAVTETGVATSGPDQGDNQTALHKSGNGQMDWYQKMQSAVANSGASYFLVWANFSEKDGFYTPYVKSMNEDGTLYGHEMLDAFIEYYNDANSIFAVDQIEALNSLDSLVVTANPTTKGPTGYITSPVAGSRILDNILLTSRINGITNEETVKYVLHGDVDVELIATRGEDGVTYTATLDKERLLTLGEAIGMIELFVGDKSMNKINATYNIPEPEEDPYQIDGFENYYGVDLLLSKKWATNKASGSTIAITLTNTENTYYSGDYGMSFTYNETSDGWAGATISKEVNWSNCNALQFYTVPDGNNQKVVIQLTANGEVYETYLNLYEGYSDSTSPMLVTIPFSEFCKRDVSGNPKGGLINDATSVTSFGLWVNAVEGSDAVVDGKVSGTIYYDDITAVQTKLTEADFKVLTSVVDNGSSNGGSNGGNGNSGIDSDIEEAPSQEQSTPKVVTKLKSKVWAWLTNEDKKLNTTISKSIPKGKEMSYIALDILEDKVDKKEKAEIDLSILKLLEDTKVVYVYAYNKDANQIERLNKTRYTISKDGSATIAIERNATYLVFPYELDSSKVIKRIDQTKVNKTKNVKVGSKVTLKPMIRKEFVAATIIYRSENSKIATINKKGAIQGKRKGSTTIYTTVAFGKSKKVFKTKITVK